VLFTALVCKKNGLFVQVSSLINIPLGVDKNCGGGIEPAILFS